MILKKCCDRNGTKVVGTKLQILKCLIDALTKILMFLFKFSYDFDEKTQKHPNTRRGLLSVKNCTPKKKFKIIQIPRV